MAAGTKVKSLWEDVPAENQWEDVSVEDQRKDIPALNAKPSLLDQIRQELEPSPGEGPVTRGFKGSWRGMLGMATSPLEVAKAAFTPPQTPEESIASSFSPTPLPLLAHRMVVEPARRSFAQAKESWGQGRPFRAAIHGAAGLVPMVGPYIDQLITRGEQGDISGALTEAGTGLATGWTAGKVAGKASNLFRTEPKQALTQAIMRGRRYKNTTAQQSIEKGIPALAATEKSMGNPIIEGMQSESINNFVDVVSQAKRDIWNQYEQQHLNRVGKMEPVYTPKRLALPPGPIELGPTNPGKVPQAVVTSRLPGNDVFGQWQAGNIASKLEDAKNAQLIDVINQREGKSARMSAQAAQNPRIAMPEDVFSISYKNAIDGNIIADAGNSSLKLLTKQMPSKQGIVKQIMADNESFRKPYSISDAEQLLHDMNQELMTYYTKTRIGKRSAEGSPVIASKEARADALRQALYDKLDELTGPGARELKEQYGALLNIEKEAVSRAAQVSGQAPMDLPQQLGTFYGISRMFRHPIEGTADILIAKKLKEMNSTNYLIQRAFEDMQKKRTGTLKQIPQTLPLSQTVNIDWRRNQR
jgi:hypothetical protein